MAVENDIVLIHFEDKPLAFARIESITADVKPNWYQVELLLLQIPVQLVTWILREAYIDGAEFTMNGKRMRMEKVEVPEKKQPKETKPTPNPSVPPKPSKIISLKDSKKRKDS